MQMQRIVSLFIPCININITIDTVFKALMGLETETYRVVDECSTN